MITFPCKDCEGQCCKPPAVAYLPEIERILEYVYEQKIPMLKHDDGFCAFFDKAGNRCLICPVRPVMCRLRGWVPDMPCYKLQIEGKQPKPLDLTFKQAETVKRQKRFICVWKKSETSRLCLDYPLVVKAMEAYKQKRFGQEPRKCKNCGRELKPDEDNPCRLCKPRKTVMVEQRRFRWQRIPGSSS